MTDQDLNLLARWYDAQTKLKEATEVERQLRAAVVNSFFVNKVETKGTHKVELPSGHVIKLTVRENVTLAKRELVDNALDKIVKHKEGGEFIAENIIRWKPELDAKFYIAAPDTIRRILDNVITRKIGTPSLEIEGPK